MATNGNNHITWSTTEMDPNLFNFIKTNLNSFVKWELMRFFDENPYVGGTAEKIASYINRKASTVKPALEDLANSGLMRKKVTNGETIYWLAHDSEMRALMNKLRLAFENRHFRTEAINYILPGSR